MKLIVGLGNPGNKFKSNRHNLGFMVCDQMAVDLGIAWTKNRDLISQLAKDREVIIVKPDTFMNKSGESAKAVFNFYKIGHKDLLIIHDDLDLDFGKIRLSFGGSAAGHLGVESVIKSLGTADFCRLRVGIGRPPTQVDPEKYVIHDFLQIEKEQLPKIIGKCQEAVRSYLDDGVEATMNRFN